MVSKSKAVVNKKKQLLFNVIKRVYISIVAITLRLLKLLYYL